MWACVVINGLQGYVEGDRNCEQAARYLDEAGFHFASMLAPARDFSLPL